jgi:citrate lyase subunit beta / citryl-CoA lyase
MTTTSHPLRSVLYMPGSNARALEKAQNLAADCLIFDLEDAVAPDAKEEARKQVCDAAASGAYGKRHIVIRCNGLDTPWGADDITAIAKSGASAVLVPKVESADMVKSVESQMEAAGAPADQTIWCMMETPMGMLHAEEIASASHRLSCFVMGTSDLVKDMHAQHTTMRLPVLTGLSLSVLAARAYGLRVLDGVYLDLADDEGFVASCQQGVELGFDGKTLIHPKQLAPTNEAFGLSEEDVAYAKKIIAAFEEVQKEGKFVVLVDGKLIEILHVEIAQRQVEMADAIAALEADMG